KGAYAFYRVPGEDHRYPIWTYKADAEGGWYFRFAKEQFEARRKAVRQLFENSIFDLVTNIDNSVLQQMGGYLNLFPGCMRLRDCVAVSYRAVQVDDLLTIDIASVSLPSINPAAAHGQQKGIKLLY